MQQDVHMGNTSLFCYRVLVFSPLVYTRLEIMCVIRFGSSLRGFFFGINIFFLGMHVEAFRHYWFIWGRQRSDTISVDNWPLCDTDRSGLHAVRCDM